MLLFVAVAKAFSRIASNRFHQIKKTAPEKVME